MYEIDSSGRRLAAALPAQGAARSGAS